MKKFLPLFLLLAVAQVASGATLFSDDFNRANNTTVDATNWVETASGNWAITSNAVVSSSAGSLIATTSAHAAAADSKATVTITVTTTLDGGPTVRASTDGQNGYFLDVIKAAGTMSVWRRVANADTQIGADITGITIANGDTYTLEASGTGATVTLKAYQNGIQRGSNFSDTSGSRITTAGQAGIQDFGGATYDGFLWEDLTGGGGGTVCNPISGRCGTAAPPIVLLVKKRDLPLLFAYIPDTHFARLSIGQHLRALQ